MNPLTRALRLPPGLVVAFDLDGTLIDTAGDLAAAMNHALAAEGLPAIAPDAVRGMVGRGAAAMLRAGYSQHGVAADQARIEAALARFLGHYDANIDRCSRPFPRIIEAIDCLRAAGAATAVCTNKREAAARLLIDRLGLAGRFDAIVGGDTAALPKPDPAPVLLSVARAGGSVCVFIGDSDTDLEAARAAGAPCLLATYGYGPTTLAETAFARFSDCGDIPALVERAANTAEATRHIPAV